jgi:anti-sigma regulatory factor (Ser/Thr protein kinase)
MKESRTFPNHPESVIKARRFVAAATARLPVDAREVVELMVSELATNAVRHTDSGFAVDVEVTPEVIRIEVTDKGAGEPRNTRLRRWSHLAEDCGSSRGSPMTGGLSRPTQLARRSGSPRPWRVQPRGRGQGLPTTSADRSGPVTSSCLEASVAIRSASRERTRPSMSATIGRTCSTVRPAGSVSSQSR